MKSLLSELILPNGVKLSNKIAKSAMSENLGNTKHAPTPTLLKVYEKWALGSAGLLITGNIMVNSTALGEPLNVVVENEAHLNNGQILLKELKPIFGLN